MPVLARPAARRIRGGAGEDGFSLLEVVVAFTLFTVMSLASAAAIVRLSQLSNATQDRVEATSLARERIEQLRSQNNGGRALDSTAITRGAFTIRPQMTPAANEACSVGQARAVTVTVSWSGGRSVRVDTVLAC